MISKKRAVNQKETKKERLYLIAEKRALDELTCKYVDENATWNYGGFD
jgi:hypothetical protein